MYFFLLPLTDYLHIMTKIPTKQREAISEIYLMCIVSTEIRIKLSVMSHFYTAIRSALIKAGVIEFKKTFDNKKGAYKYEIVRDDSFNSAKQLQDAKSMLYDAYSALARRDTWIRAEQLAIDVMEKLSELGYVHEFIDVDSERWNATYYMTSPMGKGGEDKSDD